MASRWLFQLLIDSVLYIGEELSLSVFLNTITDSGVDSPFSLEVFLTQSILLLLNL